MRCDGPLCCWSLLCADDDEAAGAGRLRKLSAPGMRRLLVLVCPIFAMFVAIIGAQWLEV